MATHKGRRHAKCVDCGKPPTDQSPLSTRGLHEACALERMTKSARQLQAKEGPYYDQWRKSIAAGARRVMELYGE